MVAKRVIPCLDVHEGRVVKGVKFQDLKPMGEPPALAERYGQEGADEVCFLDISATIEGRKTLLDVVRKTAERLFVPLTVGGGVRTLEDAQRLLRAGADKVAINTAAFENPPLMRQIAREYGVQCVVVAIDAKREGNQWIVHTHAGKKRTGHDAVAWAKKAVEFGAGEVLLTSIDADGTRAGYDLALTAAVAKAVPVPVVASGGAGTPHDALLAVSEGKADAALLASLFHTGQETPLSVKKYMAAHGVEVRT